MSPRPLPDSPFNALRVPVPIAEYALDDRVSHDAYGIGTVVSVESDVAVTVDFGTQQVRIVSPFRKVSKL